ncbi:MAG TPA: hypothetical protein PLC07_04035 [Bacillota bacterium]|nr:hypothetical protein [Bacillota bacterium]
MRVAAEVLKAAITLAVEAIAAAVTTVVALLYLRMLWLNLGSKVLRLYRPLSSPLRDDRRRWW